LESVSNKDFKLTFSTVNTCRETPGGGVVVPWSRNSHHPSSCSSQVSQPELLFVTSLSPSMPQRAEMEGSNSSPRHVAVYNGFRDTAGSPEPLSAASIRFSDQRRGPPSAAAFSAEPIFCCRAVSPAPASVGSSYLDLPASSAYRCSAPPGAFRDRNFPARASAGNRDRLPSCEPQFLADRPQVLDTKAVTSAKAFFPPLRIQNRNPPARGPEVNRACAPTHAIGDHRTTAAKYVNLRLAA